MLCDTSDEQGHVDADGSDARFIQPRGLAFGVSSDVLYVTDYGFVLVLVLLPSLLL